MSAVATKKRKPAHPPLWNPELLEKKQLPEPFDELQLDWVEELAYYILSNKHRITKTTVIPKTELTEGWFVYKVTDFYNRHILSVETSRDLQLAPKKRRKRK
jgi:hypothetical protein